MSITREPSLLGVALRSPPSNVQAEQALLGALLSNNKALDSIAGFLRPEHFAHGEHGRIYRSIATAAINGRIADAVTLKAEYDHAGVLDQVGGAAYLAKLMGAAVGVPNAGDYGRAVFEAWQRRELIDIGMELVNSAFAAEQPPTELAGAIAARMDHVTTVGRERAPTSWNEAMDAVLRAAEDAARRQGPIGVSTGMPAVDAVLGGFEPGTFTILAGRPGMGKTALGLQWAINAALAGHRVYIVSLEMPARALARRAMASAANVSVARIRRGDLGADTERLVIARRDMAGLPLTIEDNGGLTPAMIALKARIWRRRHGMDLLVLDHLHIVRPEASDVRAGATWAVGQVAQSLQQLAHDLNVPILALAQLNRSPDARDDHRPTKADLRQAGDIEQCADAIAFIYRPEYYIGKSEPERKDREHEEQYRRRVDDWNLRRQEAIGKAELIFDKVRDGATGMVRMLWRADAMCFSEIGTGD